MGQRDGSDMQVIAQSGSQKVVGMIDWPRPEATEATEATPFALLNLTNTEYVRKRDYSWTIFECLDRNMTVTAN